MTEVTATSARLRAKINPNEATATYRFDYIAQGAYRANLEALPPREGFAGAAKAPLSGSGSVGSCPSMVCAQHIAGLAPATVYRFRAVASSHCNPAEPAELCTTIGPERSLGTEEATNVFSLPDGRGWEMVSPIDKGGGAIQPPEAIFGGGVFQAAADGHSLTYSSADSFGPAQGAPAGSQYIATRAAGGWSSQNITAPTLSGGYGDHPNGVPYQLFSGDLARSLLLNGRRCGEAEACPRSYSLRDSATGALTPLPEAPDLRILTASPDLGHVIFESEGSLYEWSGGGLVPISPPPPNTGVLGTSADGSIIYFQTEAGLFISREGATTEIAPGAEAAQPSDYPPGAGTARVSADGSHLLFVSAAELTGYENTDAGSGQPDSEVFLYGPPPGGGPATLTCVSCNPTGERPQGGSSVPGAIANGQGAGATRAYKPRALSADGRRVFFDSADRLAIADTDNRPDVYEWEAQGTGGCAREGGCTGLISSGRSGEASTFIDASANGSDAFFLTDSSLAFGDPGSFDVYDAREGGGFAPPPNVIPCEGDACQSLPEAPEDPTPGTLVPNAGNPPLRFASSAKKHRHRNKGHRRRPKHRGRR